MKTLFVFLFALASYHSVAQAAAGGVVTPGADTRYIRPLNARTAELILHFKATILCDSQASRVSPVRGVKYKYDSDGGVIGSRHVPLAQADFAEADYRCR